MGSVGNVSHGDVCAECRRRNTRSDYTYGFFLEKERRRAKVSGIQEREVLQKDQRSALTNFLFTQRIQDFTTFSRWGAYNLKADPSPGRSVGKFLEDSRFSRERRLSVGRASVLA